MQGSETEAGKQVVGDGGSGDATDGDINVDCSCGDQHILSLPAEVLEHIWVDRNLDYTDVCRLSSVCSIFRDISNGNEVWKRKLCQRCVVFFSM